MILQPEVPRVFVPLLAPARYKGAHGGRGSGKSHFFAQMLVLRCLSAETRAVCVREVQKSLKQSVKRLIEDKIRALGVGHLFQVLETEIRGPHGSLIVFQGMQDHTAETIKSLEGFDVAWFEEAQAASQISLTLLRPTIRKPGSELWFSWNPRSRRDPVDALLRGDGKPTGAVVVQANWSDNPWFPAELMQERKDDLRDRPDTYDHIWEGDYAKVVEGAYYAQSISQMRREGRLCRVSADPLMTVRAVWDIGGTGAKADATAIWVVQYVGREIRVLDYYEAKGQPLGAHVAWLRANGWAKALCVLPHDGGNGEKVFAVTYESELRNAGFEVRVIPNQGAGAAKMRVEAARRLFPRVWMNESTTQGGLEALAHYHERKDEQRGIGLGPNHDWSSHAADAWGLVCVAYEEPSPVAAYDHFEIPAYGVV